jgi:serine/threonine protein kinase
MHSRNVCHYDIKLENIMLDDSFSVKVIDFGLSGSNKIFSNDIKGTLGYIAPEFCKSPTKKEALKGEKADVFALGVVLFGLYFGFLPFESTNYCDFEASPLCSGDADRVE